MQQQGTRIFNAIDCQLTSAIMIDLLYLLIFFGSMLNGGCKWTLLSEADVLLGPYAVVSFIGQKCHVLNQSKVYDFPVMS